MTAGSTYRGRVCDRLRKIRVCAPRFLLCSPSGHPQRRLMGLSVHFHWVWIPQACTRAPLSSFQPRFSPCGSFPSVIPSGDERLSTGRAPGHPGAALGHLLLLHHPHYPPSSLSMTIQRGSVCMCVDVVGVEGSRRSGIWGAALHLMEHFSCCRSAGLLIPLLNALTAGLNSNRKGKCLLKWEDPCFM